MNFETSENLPKYFRTIRKSEPLTHDRELELVCLIREGDRLALNELVQANLLFVVKIANRHRGQGVPIDDLIQEGNIGLIEAAKKFNPKEGQRFIAYASLWIRKRLNEAVAKTGRIVRLPHNQEYEIYKAKMKNEEVEEPRRTYIDDRVGEDGGSSLGDIILNSPSEVETEIEMDATRFKVKQALSTIKERDRMIVMDYFGIDREYALPTDAIAERYDMTNVRVCQIVKTSLEKMRLS
jgi:RNA polymerase primary sigma factor